MLGTITEERAREMQRNDQEMVYSETELQVI